MAEEIFKDTLTARVRDETFEFKIPSIHDEIRIGGRVRELRKKLDPSWNTVEQGLEGDYLFYLRACATFELQLLRSSAKWPWSEGVRDNKQILVVDSATFPADKIQDVVDIFINYQDLLAFFRQKRPGDSNSVGTQAVASQ